MGICFKTGLCRCRKYSCFLSVVDKSRASLCEGVRDFLFDGEI